MVHQRTYDPTIGQSHDDEIRTAGPKDALPIAETLTVRVRTPGTVPTEPLGALFIAAYVAAYFGAWIAVVTPVLVTLALRVQQINPTGKAGSLSTGLGIGAFLAIGGGGNYTALFIAAAISAFLGARSIQPIKGVR